jgi:hypothetical protein
MFLFIFCALLISLPLGSRLSVQGLTGLIKQANCRGRLRSLSSAGTMLRFLPNVGNLDSTPTSVRLDAHHSLSPAFTRWPIEQHELLPKLVFFLSVHFLRLRVTLTHDPIHHSLPIFPDPPDPSRHHRILPLLTPNSSSTRSLLLPSPFFLLPHSCLVLALSTNLLSPTITHLILLHLPHFTTDPKPTSTSILPTPVRPELAPIFFVA